jgi:hypothetical protein
MKKRENTVDYSVVPINQAEKRKGQAERTRTARAERTHTATASGKDTHCKRKGHTLQGWASSTQPSPNDL